MAYLLKKKSGSGHATPNILYTAGTKRKINKEQETCDEYEQKQTQML